MTPEASLHPGELLLRRAAAQEEVGPEVHEHLKACERCRARVKSFEDEQRRFEAAIPFERFAAGVERAARSSSGRKAERPMRWVMALAAGLLALTAGGLIYQANREGPGVRVKGGGGIDVRIAAPSGVQRDGSPDPLLPETLSSGERVRIGYHQLRERYIAVVSVDEKGEVTAIYPAEGKSLPVKPEGDYLPESLEFTGAGIERVIVVASNEPLDAEELKRATKERFDEARGNLLQMGRLDVPGEQFHRTFRKP